MINEKEIKIPVKDLTVGVNVSNLDEFSAMADEVKNDMQKLEEIVAKTNADIEKLNKIELCARIVPIKRD